MAINKDSIANYRFEENEFKNQSKLQKIINLKNSNPIEDEYSKNTFQKDNLNKKIEDFTKKLPPADTDAKRNFAQVINQIDQMNLELRKSLSTLKDDSSFNLLFESYEKDFQEIGTYFNTPKRELDTYLEASYKNLKHSDNLITRLHLLTLAKYACPNVDTTPYLLEELENYKIRNSISLTTDEERTEASLQRNLLARLLAQNYRLTWDQKNSLRSEFLEENFSERLILFQSCQKVRQQSISCSKPNSLHNLKNSLTFSLKIKRRSEDLSFLKLINDTENKGKNEKATSSNFHIGSIRSLSKSFCCDFDF